MREALRTNEAFDATDPDAIEERNEAVEAQEKRRLRDERHAIKYVMTHPDGRRFVSMMLSELIPPRGKVFTGNALTTSYNAGIMEKGLDLRARIESLEPQHYFTMLTEIKEIDNA